MGCERHIVLYSASTGYNKMIQGQDESRMKKNRGYKYFVGAKKSWADLHAFQLRWMQENGLDGRMSPHLLCQGANHEPHPHSGG
jgi:hypothetical protein